MKFVISGASGILARLIADELVAKIPASDLILSTRNPAALEDWAGRGAKVVRGDHGDLDSLKAGYEGGRRLMAISGLNIGQRIQEHSNVIEAAKAVGIEHITYTSVAGVHPGNPTPSAKEHLATERMLWASGLSFTALRDQLYSELLYDQLKVLALPTGKWLHIGEKGHIAPVSRSDIAASAAATMLAPEKHDRVVYEMTGPERLTYREIAQIGARVFGKPIEYIPIPPEQMQEMLAKIGAKREPNPTSDFPPVRFGSDELVNQFIANDEGYLDILSYHVEFLTGRKPRSLESVLQELIASCGA
jgi:NAD(P)H dehydrogenase (quinone)